MISGPALRNKKKKIHCITFMSPTNFGYRIIKIYMYIRKNIAKAPCLDLWNGNLFLSIVWWGVMVLHWLSVCPSICRLPVNRPSIHIFVAGQ